MFSLWTPIRIARLALVLGAGAAHAQPGGGRPGGAPSGPAGGQAQGVIAGRVTDAEARESLPSASVAVWRSADSTLVTGAVSDLDGDFRIEGVPAGLYYVVVSSVGYATERRGGVEVGPGAAVADLGTIALTPDAAVLEGVEVTGARERAEQQIDRTVYRVADDPVVQGGSASNALETIPSIEVDVDGNVSLRGVGNVAILVNGRPAPVSRELLASYLQSLPAGALDRIEVMPNPSARYEPDGLGGLINLVLKENTDLGWGGTLTAGGDTQGGTNATALVTYGRGPLNLSGTLGLRRDVRTSEGDRFRINRYLAPDSQTTLGIVETEDNARPSALASLSAEYALGRRTTLSAQAQGGLRGGGEDEVNTYLETDASGATLLNYERLADTGNESWNGDLRLALRHDFGLPGTGRGQAGSDGPGSGGGPGGPGGGPGGPGGGRDGGGSSGANLGQHSVAIEARVNASAGTDDETFTDRLVGGAADVLEVQETRTDDDRQSGSFQVDYARPLGGWRLEAGYKGTAERRSTDFASATATAGGPLVPDDGLSNAFDFDETTQAGYAQLGRQFGPLGLQAGVRVEAANTTFTLANAGQAYENNYASVFPSAFATYAVGERGALRASYSRRINRPRPFFLNPFPSYDDPLNLRVGNPALRPEYTDAFEVGATAYTSWGSLALTPYYRRTTDVIRGFQDVDSTSGVTTFTFANFDESESYGVEAVASVGGSGALRALRGTLSVEGFRQVTDGSTVEAGLASDAFGWGGRANVSWQVGDRVGLGDLTLQANARYRAPQETEQGRRGAQTFLDLALRQELLQGRANLTLRARDPFGLAREVGIIDQPDLYQEFERQFGARQVGVTFSYSFGRSQQRRAERPESGDEGGDELN